MSGPRYDELSDEAFLNQEMVQEAAPVVEARETAPVETQVVEQVQEIEAETGDEAEGDDSFGDVSDEDLGNDAGVVAETEDAPEPEAAPQEASAPVEDHTTPKQTEAADPVTPDGAPDYKALYEQVMGTFRANGKEITPASPEEAVRLMQMGANYSKKMGALKPHLKLLRMLENNQLLEEGKINFLIDLDKKDPKAIQKLLHDGKLDPLDLDPSAEPTYKPGNHLVSDQEMAFRETVDTVLETPTGKDTIALVNKDWDQASKQVIYQEPQLLKILDEQRSNGLYAKIAGEIERRKLFGEFQNVPFIQAYKTVGDELHAQGKLLPAGGPAGQPTPAPQAVQNQALDTRPARSSKPAASREQVRAVSSAPGTSKPSARPSMNPLTMSDDEIMSIPSHF